LLDVTFLRLKTGLKGNHLAYTETIQQEVTAGLTTMPKLLPEELPAMTSLLEQFCICRIVGVSRVTGKAFTHILFTTKYAQGVKLYDPPTYIYTITGMGIKISHETGKMAYTANMYERL
jgi:hypothetical protein